MGDAAGSRGIAELNTQDWQAAATSDSTLLLAPSTWTLIIHVADRNSTNEKEIRISGEPDAHDPTTHNPETDDTLTNPTRNHFQPLHRSSIAPPPPPPSLPAPFNHAAAARKGPPLPIATAPQTPIQSVKMSGRGL
ncbi:hypothetical protein CC2G_008426 [Coprinopsis cinerea AmutBmut pab1-1]|nr:hypothetical protein CC2G_008426 [Coprinopsis cinerea AmutBmut pab1-1]